VPRGGAVEPAIFTLFNASRPPGADYTLICERKPLFCRRARSAVRARTERVGRPGRARRTSRPCWPSQPAPLGGD